MLNITPEKVDVLFIVIFDQVKEFVVIYVVPLHRFVVVVLLIIGEFGVIGEPLTKTLTPELFVAEVGNGATLNCELAIKSKTTSTPFGKVGVIDIFKLLPDLISVRLYVVGKELSVNVTICVCDAPVESLVTIE